LYVWWGLIGVVWGRVGCPPAGVVGSCLRCLRYLAFLIDGAQAYEWHESVDLP